MFRQRPYQGHSLMHEAAVYHRAVNVNLRFADSLILAGFNLFVAFSGFILLHTSYSAWLTIVCWILLPPLLVTTLLFWGRDLRKPTARRQAIVAFLLSVPVLVLEVWFFKHLNL
jgi:RsiW-degrading membrane proteinase PrsW (M82 family)